MLRIYIIDSDYSEKVKDTLGKILKDFGYDDIDTLHNIVTYNYDIITLYDKGEVMIGLILKDINRSDVFIFYSNKERQNDINKIKDLFMNALMNKINEMGQIDEIDPQNLMDIANDIVVQKIPYEVFFRVMMNVFEEHKKTINFKEYEESNSFIVRKSKTRDIEYKIVKKNHIIEGINIEHYRKKFGLDELVNDNPNEMEKYDISYI